MVDTRAGETVVLPVSDTGVVVVAVTGSHPDGAVGLLVAERLRDRLPEGVRLLLSTELGREFAELDGSTHVLVVDCLDVGRTPGAVVIFAGEALTPCVARATFRDKWLVHYLVLAGQHADAPEEVVLLGVQHDPHGVPGRLSAEVEAAVPELVERAAGVVAAWLDPLAPKSSRRDQLPEC